jgi:hypothetical protein
MVPRPILSLYRYALVWAIWVLIAASAALYVGHELSNGLGRADSGYLETPLALALAGQLRDGFGTLYGPFTGSRPLVLIHAPLYYRLVGVAAWPFVSSGLDVLSTCLVAGRFFSFVATIVALVAAFRISRLDGAPRAAGVLTVLLISSSAIIGCRWATVRPDSLALAFQTLGVYYVLKSVHEGSFRFGPLATASVAFALAFCAKQHNVVALGVSTLLLGFEWWRGRARWVPLLAAALLGVVVVVGYFLWENWLTSGLTTVSVFALPGGPFRSINYGSPKHLAWVGSIVVKMSLGLMAIAGVCAWGRWNWRTLRPVDAALWAYLAAELLSLAPLCVFNLGAAENYAVQAVVFAGVLLARALNPLLVEGSSLKRLSALAVAASLLLALDVRLLGIAAAFQSRHREMLDAVLASSEVADCAPEARFFAYATHLNRLHGRCSLAHDEWLYSAYEMVGAAEPRESWLKNALENGTVRQVIVVRPPEKGPASLPGLSESLPELGYVLVSRIGTYYVWNKQAGVARQKAGVSVAAGADRSIAGRMWVP